MVRPDQLASPRDDSGRGSAGSYIMIAGPTASGKSQLALELAASVDGEIINADAMQLYADLLVLTARRPRLTLQLLRIIYTGYWMRRIGHRWLLGLILPPPPRPTLRPAQRCRSLLVGQACICRRRSTASRRYPMCPPPSINPASHGTIRLEVPPFGRNWLETRSLPGAWPMETVSD